MPRAHVSPCSPLYAISQPEVEKWISGQLSGFFSFEKTENPGFANSQPDDMSKSFHVSESVSIHSSVKQGLKKKKKSAAHHTG